MQAIIFEGPGILRFTTVPEPFPSSGEVKLRILMAGICSTDVHIFKGRFPVQPPRILGHELVGMVEAVGRDVSNEWLGKICGVRPAWFCGLCQACQQGSPELCLNFQCLGNTHDGGFAEKTIVGVDQLVRSPDLDPQALVWLEPLACVVHALDLFQPIGNKSVLVVGAGSVGRLMIQTLHSISSARIAVVDPHPEKIKLALALGAHAGWVVPRKGNTLQVDRYIRDWSKTGPQVVIDTTGHPEAVERALDWAGLAGKVVLFGVSDPASKIRIQLEDIFNKELDIQAIVGMTPNSFQSAYHLLQSRAVDPLSQATVHISLDQVPQSLEDRALLGIGKVIILPQGDNQ
jgi:2-desacetyl-2-hydroxyethyl bacteriochlorophyllide A dehydrogenase